MSDDNDDPMNESETETISKSDLIASISRMRDTYAYSAKDFKTMGKMDMYAVMRQSALVCTFIMRMIEDMEDQRL